MNLVLIGFMGVGKTTVGKRLAEGLGWSFVDTDASIEKTSSMAVSQIFEQFGEPLFRRMEKAAVDVVSKMDHCVIATGGGVVLDPESIGKLKRNGLLIHLDLSPETIVDRIGQEISRPLLRGENPLITLETLHRTRSSLYRTYSDVRVNREGMDVEQTIEKILGMIRSCHEGALEP